MVSNEYLTRIILKNDSTVNWDANESVVLFKGEIGLEFLESGKVKMKVGDGEKTWAELPYFGGNETEVFEVTLETDETDDNAITRVVGNSTPVKGDIAIVKALIAGDKYSYTAYVYNGTAWAAMDGNYSAKNVYFSKNLLFTKEFGYFVPDNTGKVVIPTADNNWSLEDVMINAHSKESEPTITQPSVGFDSVTSGAYEVGTEVTPKYDAKFNAGSYSYGPETGVTVTSWEVTDTADNKLNTETGSFPAITVTDSTSYKITAKANHTSGATPVTNWENETTGAIVAGSKSSISNAITGYRSFFYGVLSTSSAEQPLTSALVREGKDADGNVVDTALTNGGNYNASKTLTLNGSATAKRIVVLIPSTSTRAGLKEVILTSAMNTPITDSYIKTTAAVKVEGVNGATAIDYTAYVYEPASIDAGEVHKIVLA